MDEHVLREAQYVYEMAPQYEMRTGQFLFNVLRYEIAELVRNTDLDTFYQDLSLEEIIDWLANHITFNRMGDMVRLSNNHRVLWEDRRAA